MKAASPQIRGRQNQRSRPIDEPPSGSTLEYCPVRYLGTPGQYLSKIFYKLWFRLMKESHEN